MDYIVSVKGVSKSYGEVQALKDVCFEVKTGKKSSGLSDRTVQERLLFSAFSPHWC